MSAVRADKHCANGQCGVEVVPATAWIFDFVKRVLQLKVISASKDFGQSGLWFGGLLYPEAYLTATR